MKKQTKMRGDTPIKQKSKVAFEASSVPRARIFSQAEVDSMQVVIDRLQAEIQKLRNDIGQLYEEKVRMDGEVSGLRWAIQNFKVGVNNGTMQTL